MHGLSFLLYRQMSPQCIFNTSGLWQRQPGLLVLFRPVLQDLLHSQPSDWLSLTEKHSILRFLIQIFLNRAQVYFMLPTPESIPVMAGNYCVSAPRGRKSRMRNSWDCPFNTTADCNQLFSFCAWPEQKICFRYAVVVAPVVVLKVSNKKNITRRLEDTLRSFVKYCFATRK